MRRYVMLAVAVFLLFPDTVRAHGEASSVDEGRRIVEQLQRGAMRCADVAEAGLEDAGEYAMQLMTGDAHETMDAAMERAMGEAGLARMHRAMGGRVTGCAGINGSSSVGVADSSAPSMMSFMMGGMMGAGSTPIIGNGSIRMMWFNPTWSVWMWIPMVLWWALIVVALVALIRWLFELPRGGSGGTSAREILEERYARGEISKAEFEEKRRDLGARP